MPDANTDRTMPKITSADEKYAGRFLRFELVDYTDAHGVARKWEAVKRKNDQAAAIILARLVPSDRIVLIRQFRAPVGTFCLEVPAGLIDGGETPVQAAVRELKEETGYTGTVTWCGPAASSSAGLSNEMVTLVCMAVDETLPENLQPEQHLDDGEDIQVMLVKTAELGEVIRKAVEAGDVPDSRLVAWAAGMGMRW